MKPVSSHSFNLLKAYANQPNQNIQAYVAIDALESSCPITYLQDVVQYGCISGAVSRLVYYTDTHYFFDSYYDEIEMLRTNYETETGQAILIKDDLKNSLAWFAYETVASSILQEIEEL